VPTAAAALLIRRLAGLYGTTLLKNCIVIHNGAGLVEADRVSSGDFAVYASGGKVGNHDQGLTSDACVVIGRKGSAGKITFAPNGGWVTDTAYYAQPIDDCLNVKFLYYALSTRDFSQDVIATAIPGINRTSIYRHEIPVPPIEVQDQCVHYLDSLTQEPGVAPEGFEDTGDVVKKLSSMYFKLEKVLELRNEIRVDVQAMLRSAFQQVIDGAEYRPMGEVAPIVRRPVEIEPDGEYPELGVRSFGKGTFHKPVLNGIDVGTKKLYNIHPGDLVFSNVFAWEGAIAVVQPEDAGRVGSHRFITCVAEEGTTTPEFLCFYLLTDEGIEKVREASPGGAGRNRTLGLKKLEEIEIPIPNYDKQLWFNRLQAQATAIVRAQSDNQTELDALLPAILDRAFKGEL
jgi:restriction endonuclease S subunit